MLLVIILGTLGTNHIYAFKEPEPYEIPSSLALYYSPYQSLTDVRKIWRVIWKFEVPYHCIDERFTKIRYGVDLGSINLESLILGGYVRFISPIKESFYVKSEIGLQWRASFRNVPLIANLGFIYYPIKWIGLEFGIETELLRYDYSIQQNKSELVWKKLIVPRATWNAGFQILF